MLLWSTVASAFKLSLRSLEPAQLVFWAALFSTLALGAILAARGGLSGVLRNTRAQWLRSAALGFLNPFAYYLILFKAYDLLPAQEAQPLNYTWAVTLALLSVPLLGQRISRRDLLAVLVSYCGVVVIATRGDLAGLHFSSPLGVALALVSTVVWALYWIFNTKEDRDPVAALFLSFCLGLPWTLAWCLAFTGLLPEQGAASGLAGAAYVGLFEMGVTFVLWLSALKLSENTAKVGTLIFLSPFLSLVLIHFLVGEDIYPSTYAGLALIMAGLAIQQLGKKRMRGAESDCFAGQGARNPGGPFLK